MKNSRSTTRLKLKQNSNDGGGFPAFTGACGGARSQGQEAAIGGKLGSTSPKPQPSSFPARRPQSHNPFLRRHRAHLTCVGPPLTATDRGGAEGGAEELAIASP